MIAAFVEYYQTADYERLTALDRAMSYECHSRESQSDWTLYVTRTLRAFRKLYKQPKETQASA